MATRVHESCVVKAPIDKVWSTIRTLDMSFWGAVASCKTDGAEGQVGANFTISFKDGAVQQLKLLEMSDLKHFLTYDLIESEPAATVMSAIHTIRLRRVTADNSTFVEWYSDFSSDATQAVIQDSKYKKREAFEDLCKALSA